MYSIPYTKHRNVKKKIYLYRRFPLCLEKIIIRRELIAAQISPYLRMSRYQKLLLMFIRRCNTWVRTTKQQMCNSSFCYPPERSRHTMWVVLGDRLQAILTGETMLYNIKYTITSARINLRSTNCIMFFSFSEFIQLLTSNLIGIMYVISYLC